MTVHWNKQCIPVQNVICKVPTETKWNKQQPQLVMRGFAKQVIIKGNTAIIS